ncbi:TIGR03032 family protein [Aliiruegeria sabulilitoris]|uniref:TIGR03032 family protein n=1 Tax=Aliiruegeria sabulilitoris TaxID=1510458 RepID=UPI00082E35B6|nr:TIGR03032 family protein [Aliiruegeria sabulilitoris]NDR57302.1 TIGR03032 family protein [Pseudoruegeria sp. M32A2M]
MDTAPQHQGGTEQTDGKPAAINVEYSQSAGLLSRLAALDCSIAISSYQSGLLYHLGRAPTGGLHLHQTGLPKPMGLVYEGEGRLTVAGAAQIMRFENALLSHERINNTFDACFVPRRIHMTGALDAHDIGIDAKGEPIFVNTRFNCLARPSLKHSFEPVWQPPFIDTIVDEDRCHLNGLAMRDGQAAYVTAVSRSNTIDGWRDRRDSGGVVIEVETGRVVCEGLSMPHSPRWYNGRLWLLNAGTGEFGYVEGLDAATGQDSVPGRFVPLAFCPGFLRGLSFAGGYAFIGLSKPRYKRFEGLDLDRRLREADSEPWCGVQIIDLSRGACVDWFRIDGDVAELYDVTTIPGFALPMAISPDSPEVAQFVTWDTPSRHPPSPQSSSTGTPL